MTRGAGLRWRGCGPRSTSPASGRARRLSKRTAWWWATPFRSRSQSRRVSCCETRPCVANSATTTSALSTLHSHCSAAARYESFTVDFDDDNNEPQRLGELVPPIVVTALDAANRVRRANARAPAPHLCAPRDSSARSCPRQRWARSWCRWRTRGGRTRGR